MTVQKYSPTYFLPALYKLLAVGLVLMGLVGMGYCAHAVQIVSQLGPGSAGAISNVGGGDSFQTMATPDGRYVLFASTGNNLAVNSNGTAMQNFSPPYVNVFLRDRQLGTTVLVSVNTAGTGGGNGNSFPDAISTNGQYALLKVTLPTWWPVTPTARRTFTSGTWSTA
jgi:hypothetical protein